MATGIYAPDGSLRVTQSDGAGTNFGSASSGGTYNSTPILLTNGQISPVQVDARGNTYTLALPKFRQLTATIARPADIIAYTAGDIVGPTGGGEGLITFAGATDYNAQPGLILGATLEKNGTSVTTATFRLWLFEADPGTALGVDNAALTFGFGDRTNMIGSIAFGTPIGGAGLGVVYYEGVNGRANMAFQPTGSTSLFGALECTSAYTPTSGETFWVNLYLQLAAL